MPRPRRTKIAAAARTVTRGATAGRTAGATKPSMPQTMAGALPVRLELEETERVETPPQAGSTSDDSDGLIVKKPISAKKLENTETRTGQQQPHDTGTASAAAAATPVEAPEAAPKIVTDMGRGGRSPDRNADGGVRDATTPGTTRSAAPVVVQVRATPEPAQVEEEKEAMRREETPALSLTSDDSDGMIVKKPSARKRSKPGGDEAYMMRGANTLATSAARSATMAKMSGGLGLGDVKALHETPRTKRRRFELARIAREADHARDVEEQLKRGQQGRGAKGRLFEGRESINAATRGGGGDDDGARLALRDIPPSSAFAFEGRANDRASSPAITLSDFKRHILPRPPARQPGNDVELQQGRDNRRGDISDDDDDGDLGRFTPDNESTPFPPRRRQQQQQQQQQRARIQQRRITGASLEGSLRSDPLEMGIMVDQGSVASLAQMRSLASDTTGSRHAASAAAFGADLPALSREGSVIPSVEIVPVDEAEAHSFGDVDSENAENDDGDDNDDEDAMPVLKFRSAGAAAAAAALRAKKKLAPTEDARNRFARSTERTSRQETPSKQPQPLPAEWSEVMAPPMSSSEIAAAADDGRSAAPADRARKRPSEDAGFQILEDEAPRPGKRTRTAKAAPAKEVVAAAKVSGLANKASKTGKADKAEMAGKAGKAGKARKPTLSTATLQHLMPRRNRRNLRPQRGNLRRGGGGGGGGQADEFEILVTTDESAGGDDESDVYDVRSAERADRRGRPLSLAPNKGAPKTTTATIAKAGQGGAKARPASKTVGKKAPVNKTKSTASKPVPKGKSQAAAGRGRARQPKPPPASSPPGSPLSSSDKENQPGPAALLASRRAARHASAAAPAKPRTHKGLDAAAETSLFDLDSARTKRGQGAAQAPRTNLFMGKPLGDAPSARKGGKETAHRAKRQNLHDPGDEAGDEDQDTMQGHYKDKGQGQRKREPLRERHHSPDIDDDDDEEENGDDDDDGLDAAYRGSPVPRRAPLGEPRKKATAAAAAAPPRAKAGRNKDGRDGGGKGADDADDADELARMAAKFREVDEWELSFEEFTPTITVTPSPSPPQEAHDEGQELEQEQDLDQEQDYEQVHEQPEEPGRQEEEEEEEETRSLQSLASSPPPYPAAAYTAAARHDGGSTFYKHSSGALATNETRGGAAAAEDEEYLLFGIDGDNDGDNDDDDDDDDDGGAVAADMTTSTSAVGKMASAAPAANGDSRAPDFGAQEAEAGDGEEEAPAHAQEKTQRESDGDNAPPPPPPLAASTASKALNGPSSAAVLAAGKTRTLVGVAPAVATASFSRLPPPPVPPSSLSSPPQTISPALATSPTTRTTGITPALSSSSLSPSAAASSTAAAAPVSAGTATKPQALAGVSIPPPARSQKLAAQRTAADAGAGADAATDGPTKVNGADGDEGDGAQTHRRPAAQAEDQEQDQGQDQEHEHEQDPATSTASATKTTTSTATTKGRRPVRPPKAAGTITAVTEVDADTTRPRTRAAGKTAAAAAGAEAVSAPAVSAVGTRTRTRTGARTKMGRPAETAGTTVTTVAAGATGAAGMAGTGMRTRKQQGRRA